MNLALKPGEKVEVPLDLSDSRLFSLASIGHATGTAITYLQEEVSPTVPTTEGDRGPVRSGTLDINFTKRTIPVEKVAAFLAISTEMLNDQLALNAYVEQRLPVFVKSALEKYVMDKLIEEVTKIRVKPWQTNRRAIELAKRRSVSEGALPGQPDVLDIGLFHEDSSPVLFVPFGTAFVGNIREGATIWLKGDMTIEAGTQHEDYFFSKQMSALRAEQRIAVTVIRPQGFFVVKLRTWPRQLKNYLRKSK